MVIRMELSAEWSPATGLFSGIAWVIGMAIAIVVAIVAAAAAAYESARRQRRSAENA